MLSESERRGWKNPSPSLCHVKLQRVMSGTLCSHSLFELQTTGRLEGSELQIKWAAKGSKESWLTTSSRSWKRGEKMRKVDRNQRVVWDGHKKLGQTAPKSCGIGPKFEPWVDENHPEREQILHNGKLTQLLSKNTTAQRKPIRRFLNSGYMTWIPLRSSHIISYHLANPTWSLQPRSAMLLWLLPLDRHQSTEKSLAPATFFDWVIFCWISVSGQIRDFRLSISNLAYSEPGSSPLPDCREGLTDRLSNSVLLPGIEPRTGRKRDAA